MASGVDGRTVRRLHAVCGVRDVPSTQRRPSASVRGGHLPERNHSLCLGTPERRHFSCVYLCRLQVQPGEAEICRVMDVASCVVYCCERGREAGVAAADGGLPSPDCRLRAAGGHDGHSHSSRSQREAVTDCNQHGVNKCLSANRSTSTG